MTHSKREKEQGFTLLVTAVSAFVLVGMLGLAADLGRVYIVKNESQAFADFASIAAARHLNGTSAGITAANTEVANSTNKWNFNTQSFTSGIRTVEYAIKTSSSSTCPVAGPWVASPSGNVSGYGCVRVTVSPAVSLMFLPVLGTGFTQTVKGQAVAGVVPQTFPLGGYMPFTPFAHTVNCTSLSPNLPAGCDSTGNFGYSIGQEYGFLWPGNASKGNSCVGDQVNWPLYDMSDQVSGSTRGYFTLQAASSISAAIQGELQMDPLQVGDQLNMTNGQKQAEQNALVTRAGYDTDQTNYSANSSGTAPAYSGNGMRMVVMPVNSGPSSSPPFTVLGFASFLLPMSYPNGGNKVWCAIYMGSTTDGGGGVSPFNVAGAYVVRLTQ